MKCDCIEKVVAALKAEGENPTRHPEIVRAFAVVADRLAPPAEAARVGPGEANPNLSPSTVRALRHGMNCSGRAGDESGCTCGLLWRDQLETERTMHAAWRKRAEEAEAALAAQPAKAEFDAEKWAERVRYHIDNSPSVNRVEIIASEGGLLWLSAYAAGLAAREQPKRWPEGAPTDRNEIVLYKTTVMLNCGAWVERRAYEMNVGETWMPAPKEVR